MYGGSGFLPDPPEPLTVDTERMADVPRRKAAVVSLFALFGAGGCATASSGGVVPVAPPSSPSSTNVSLVGYSTNDGPRARVVLTGAVGDYGQAISVHPDGSTDPDHNSQLELRLSKGTFRLDISGLGARLAQQFQNFPSDRVSCSGLVTVSQKAPVVGGDGTGAYAHLTGSFALLVRISEVDRVGGCGPSSPFLAQAVVISGDGRVSG